MTPSIRSSPNNLADVTGRVVTPDDPEYDQTRAVFYGGIEKRPSAIVRVANVEDVRRVIATARDEGYELAIRSGGHSIVGHSTTDGGLVIDLREMSALEVDAEARTARGGGGLVAPAWDPERRYLLEHLLRIHRAEVLRSVASSACGRSTSGSYYSTRSMSGR